MYKKNKMFLKKKLSFRKTDAILDIRSIDEQNTKPLIIKNIKIKSMPFYKLDTQFINLDKNITWFLYCENGMMSRLQAIILHNKGFKNVKIF